MFRDTASRVTRHLNEVVSSTCVSCSAFTQKGDVGRVLLTKRAKRFCRHVPFPRQPTRGQRRFLEIFPEIEMRAGRDQTNGNSRNQMMPAFLSVPVSRNRGVFSGVGFQLVSIIAGSEEGSKVAFDCRHKSVCVSQNFFCILLGGSEERTIVRREPQVECLMQPF